MSSWSHWNGCIVPCGPGEQTRLRTCHQGCDNVPSEDLIETKTCSDNVCNKSVLVLSTANSNNMPHLIGMESKPDDRKSFFFEKNDLLHKIYK